MLVDKFSILCIPGCRIVKLASKKAGKGGNPQVPSCGYYSA